MCFWLIPKRDLKNKKSDYLLKNNWNRTWNINLFPVWIITLCLYIRHGTQPWGCLSWFLDWRISWRACTCLHLGTTEYATCSWKCWSKTRCNFGFAGIAQAGSWCWNFMPSTGLAFLSKPSIWQFAGKRDSWSSSLG